MGLWLLKDFQTVQKRFQIWDWVVTPFDGFTSHVKTIVFKSRHFIDIQITQS